LAKIHENEINQYRLKSEQAHTDLIEDLDSKQDDLRKARLQIELLKSTKTQFEQAQDQNERLLKLKKQKTFLLLLNCFFFRLRSEINLLQHELTSKKDLIVHYEKQISLLEKQISARGKIFFSSNVNSKDNSS
jgi:hypothetical protein